MELTDEQLEIIRSTGDIKIDAVAGSGKTTTIIQYAGSRPGRSKILYLAFNRSVKQEAARKFAERGLANVKVETAHSLAYKAVVFGNGYRVRAQGYRTNEIADMLGMKTEGESHARYVLATHVNRFLSYFCNSPVERIQDLNYLDVVADKKAREFVSAFYDYIQSQTSFLFGKMDRGEIEVTHDFYLKKFQLSNPRLQYDYILFDEGQDASPAMLDVFLQQNGIKVIVGDTHQQIYGWRFAVNSLDKAGFETHRLTTSFRFTQDIADLAVAVLTWKRHLNKDLRFFIRGKGKGRERHSSAVLARTNLGLLLKAIEFVTDSSQTQRIYFEGNINSYTYAEEGTSLYDVLSLYNGNRKIIRDKLIMEMKDIQELEDYVDKTEDVQLRMMVDIVKEYGNEIPGAIRMLKEKHVGKEEKQRADVIFSTVHRCKGMEYDNVELVDDFITEKKIERLIADHGEKVNRTKLNEEINLLYVAVTRTKNSLAIPDELVPEGIPRSSRIRISKAERPRNDRSPGFYGHPATPGNKRDSGKQGLYSVESIREKHKGAYMPWTKALDAELTEMFCRMVSTKTMAQHFGRTTGAIKARLRKLDLQ